MATTASTPSTYALPRYTVWLGRILAAGFVVGGVYEAAFGSGDDTGASLLSSFSPAPC